MQMGIILGKESSHNQKPRVMISIHGLCRTSKTLEVAGKLPVDRWTQCHSQESIMINSQRFGNRQSSTWQRYRATEESLRFEDCLYLFVRI